MRKQQSDIPDSLSLRWLTTRQAAAYLKISHQLLAQMRRDGRGPKFSVVGPKSHRYQVKDLDDFLLDRAGAR